MVGLSGQRGLVVLSGQPFSLPYDFTQQYNGDRQQQERGQQQQQQQQQQKQAPQQEQQAFEEDDEEIGGLSRFDDDPEIWGLGMIERNGRRLDMEERPLTRRRGHGARAAATTAATATEASSTTRTARAPCNLQLRMSEGSMGCGTIQSFRSVEPDASYVSLLPVSQTRQTPSEKAAFRSIMANVGLDERAMLNVERLFGWSQ